MAVLTGRVTVVAAFDQGCALVGRNPAAVGLLWLSALPVRLLLASLILTTIHLGAQAPHSRDLLLHRAGFIVLAWLVSLWGRQVFVSACLVGITGNTSRLRDLVRVPARALMAHLQAALLIEVLFWATLPLCVLWPFGIALAGLAAVTASRSEATWWQPIRSLALPTGALVVAGLTLGAGVGVAIAVMNLHFFAHGSCWLCGAFIGLDTSAWSSILHLSHPLYAVLLVVGGGLLVEPFYLAALVAVVDRAHARTSGQDLRHWLESITRSSAPLAGKAS